MAKYGLSGYKYQLSPKMPNFWNINGSRNSQYWRPPPFREEKLTFMT